VRCVSAGASGLADLPILSFHSSMPSHSPPAHPSPPSAEVSRYRLTFDSVTCFLFFPRERALGHENTWFEETRTRIICCERHGCGRDDGLGWLLKGIKDESCRGHVLDGKPWAVAGTEMWGVLAHGGKTTAGKPPIGRLT
jgi:hypothetical protein